MTKKPEDSLPQAQRTQVRAMIEEHQKIKAWGVYWVHEDTVRGPWAVTKTADEAWRELVRLYYAERTPQVLRDGLQICPVPDPKK